MNARILLSAFALTASLVHAQDGGQLYATYCAACHGAKGEGALEGQFPPLAGSPWPLGIPDRAIKIALYGIHGPIEVNGKTWKLEMPPQGALLPDDQIAAILTYVRSSWGNKADAVTTDQVKAIRAANASRAEAWTSEELLKLHPLPLEKTALTHLISQAYSGTGKTMPDFSKLTAANVEEEHDGYISLKDSPFRDNFAMAWEAGFEAPVDGAYEFFLDADDAAALMIDGKKLISVDGIGPMDGTRAKQAKISLTKGSHPFRAEFLEFTLNQGLVIGWKLASEDQWRWLTDQAGKQPRKTIPIGPEGNRPVIYRNFIEGTTPRAIGVGFPGGLNLAWSADHLAPELLWSGNFIDGSYKWEERGTDPSPPAGDHLVKLSNQRFLPAEARFKGYKLDPAGNPTFIVKIGDQILKDSWQAGQRADHAPCLIRTLSLTGGAGTVRIPLGPFATVLSEVATETRDGIAIVTLAPGRTTTHTYWMAR